MKIWCSIFVFPPFLISTIFALTTFRAGTFITTQSALNDAPERYATFVTEAIEYIRNYKVEYISGDGDCKTAYWLNGPAATKKVDLAPGSLIMKIVENGFTVQASINVFLSVPIFVRFRESIGPICFAKTLCEENTIATYSTKASVFTVFPIEWNSSTHEIDVNPRIEITAKDSEIKGCEGIIVDIVDYLYDVREEFLRAIEENANKFAQDLAAKLNLPQKFVIYNGTNTKNQKYQVWWAYKVTYFDIVPEIHMIVSVNGSLTVDLWSHTPGTPPESIVFDSLDPENAGVGVPIYWDPWIEPKSKS